jgi:hypothetical protein
MTTRHPKVHRHGGMLPRAFDRWFEGAVAPAQRFPNAAFSVTAPAGHPMQDAVTTPAQPARRPHRVLGAATWVMAAICATVAGTLVSAISHPVRLLGRPREASAQHSAKVSTAPPFAPQRTPRGAVRPAALRSPHPGGSDDQTESR